MKKKTWLKEGVYQKLDNTKGKRIKGALDFNKEVLDTLVDKDVIETTDCCSYFPTIPEIVELRDQFPPAAERIAHVPNWGLFRITTSGDESCAVIYIKLPNGNPTVFVNLC